MNENRVRSIVIVGGGTAGWMTAAALSKVLGKDYASITLVESDDIGIVGVGEATIPQIGTYNRMLGINEDEFLRHTKGSFKLGIEFVNWGQIGQSYIHPFGHYGINMKGLSFHAFWLRLNKTGMSSNLDDYSLNASAAKQNKFMRPIDAGKSPLSEIAYAFHFDAGLYAKLLRGFSENLGVRRIEGKVVGGDESVTFVANGSEPDQPEEDADERRDHLSPPRGPRSWRGRRPAGPSLPIAAPCSPAPPVT